MPEATLRALREKPGEAESPAEWEAFLLDAIQRAPLPDFGHYGEPYPALNGVVLTHAQHRQLVGVTERFAGIFEKATTALAADEDALERLGFPWVAIELLHREPAAVPVILGRFDFLLDAEGRWQLLEYNADTPSGLREAVEIEAAIARHLGAQAGTQALRRSGPVLAAAVRRAFGAALSVGGDAGGARLVGLVTDAGYLEDLCQTAFLARLLARGLGRRGVEVVYGDVDNLRAARGRLCLLGRPLDALYRYYPLEVLLGRQEFVDLFATVAAGRLLLLNGLRGLLAQNKGLLAWLWEHREDGERFTPQERRTIAEHLPPVWWIDDARAEAAARETLVLKQVFGREGEEVYFGDRVAPEDWARCRAWRSYVVQQRVRAAPVAAVVPTSAGPEVQALWPVVGSFAARRRWAGYYTRLGEPITTGHAKFFGTFWEPA